MSDTATLEQRTDEWFQARLGKVTASHLSDVLAKGEGKTRKAYMVQLAVERMTGRKADSYTSRWMDEGTEKEPMARSAYEAVTGQIVREVGFIEHPSIPNCGASPDGLVGDEGTIEIKCPKLSTHMDTVLTRKIDGGYIKQIQLGLDCTGRQWCDFVSYNPEAPEGLDIIVLRVWRDEAFITEAREQIVRFLSDLDELVKNLEAARAHS